MFLAKRQGIETWRKAQEQMQYGYMPGNEIIDGICILIGGIFLVLPGLISDVIGIILLLPLTRNMLKTDCYSLDYEQNEPWESNGHSI